MNIKINEIHEILTEHKMVLEEIILAHVEDILNITEILIRVINSGGIIYLCGNGGSAADAQHVAAELVGKFLHERKALPAIALTTNSSIISAISNDYEFSSVFERQVYALMREGDLLVGISTSGESENILKAVKAAKKMNCKTVGFVGKNQSELSNIVDYCIHIPSENTPRIQEMHILVWHAICEKIETHFINL